MDFDWIVLAVGFAGSLYLFVNADRLATGPRRGTEWRPSRHVWLLAATALLFAAIGALINLVTS